MIILLISTLGNELNTFRAKTMNFLISLVKTKKTTDHIRCGSNIEGKSIGIEYWIKLQFTVKMTFKQVVQRHDLEEISYHCNLE